MATTEMIFTSAWLADGWPDADKAQAISIRIIIEAGQVIVMTAA